ncbi:MAG: GNAT family N-acetyltransferase [Verrucomicrobia bacterium]|nr:GNAT family N-acetyltransferase [Verrucomicrobiota bacterium]
MIPANRHRVEILDQIAPLEDLVEPWTELWSCARFATPFQHPAWILAFYRELAIPEPRILAAWQGPRLKVLAPFYLWRTADGPASLILAGNGVSDYLDALVRPGAEPCAAEAIRVFMARSGSEWTTADFRDLDPQASLCLLPWPGAVSDAKLPEEGCPRLALGSRRLDDALATASKRLRRDLERARRKLDDEGLLEVSVAGPDTLISDYAELVALHTARWQTAGGPGIFGADYHRRFFRAAFAGLMRAGLLRLFVIRLNGEPIAATCGFLHHGHYYHFIAGYDPRWSHLSLGSFAVYVALRAAVNEGAACFDFLRGKEAYKYRWGARDHQTYRRQLRVAGNG